MTHWTKTDTLEHTRSVRQDTLTQTQPDLAGINAPFLVAGTEHTGGDLAVIVVRSVADSVADDGDVCFLQNICQVTWGGAGTQ